MFLGIAQPTMDKHLHALILMFVSLSCWHVNHLCKGFGFGTKSETKSNGILEIKGKTTIMRVLSKKP